MQEYIGPIWLVIFIFLSLIVLFTLSKLLIIKTKLEQVEFYNKKISELYESDSSENREEEVIEA